MHFYRIIFVTMLFFISDKAQALPKINLQNPKFNSFLDAVNNEFKSFYALSLITTAPTRKHLKEIIDLFANCAAQVEEMKKSFSLTEWKELLKHLLVFKDEAIKAIKATPDHDISKKSSLHSDIEQIRILIQMAKKHIRMLSKKRKVKTTTTSAPKMTRVK